MKKRNKQKTFQFDIPVNGSTVEVTVSPYVVNDKQRFRVSYNGSPVHVFGWDEDADRIVIIDSAASVIAPDVKNAIANELHSHVMQAAA